jgi:hypothetical protein
LTGPLGGLLRGFELLLGYLLDFVCMGTDVSLVLAGERSYIVGLPAAAERRLEQQPGTSPGSRLL